MNKISGWLMAVVMCTTFAFGADDHFTALISEQSVGGVCIYPQKFFASVVGKMILERVKADGVADLDELQNAIGIDLKNDVTRAVLSLINPTTEEVYVVVEGKFDLTKIEQYLNSKQLPEFRAEDRAGLRQFSWQENSSKPDKRIIMILLADNKLLFANDEKSAAAGVAIVTGKSKNAVGSPLFAETKIADSVAFIEGAIKLENLPEIAGGIENPQSATYVLYERADKKLALKVLLTMVNAEAATNLQKTLMGFKMMLCVKIPALSALEIKNDAAKIALEVAMSENEITALLEKLTAEETSDDNEIEINDEDLDKEDAK